MGIGKSLEHFQSSLADCWIYRNHDQDGFGATMNPGDMPTYNFRFNSMTDMVAAHRAVIEGNNDNCCHKCAGYIRFE